jgi:hypothetical protein
MKPGKISTGKKVKGNLGLATLKRDS